MHLAKLECVGHMPGVARKACLRRGPLAGSWWGGCEAQHLPSCRGTGWQAHLEIVQDCSRGHQQGTQLPGQDIGGLSTSDAHPLVHSLQGTGCVSLVAMQMRCVGMQALAQDVFCTADTQVGDYARTWLKVTVQWSS